jgi:Mor family transcriptional regulator
MNFLGSLRKLGGSVSMFNPVLGDSLILVSSLLDYFDVYPEKVLEKNVIGLSKSSNVIKELVANDDFDKNKLLEIAENLEAMNKLIFKFQKILN